MVLALEDKHLIKKAIKNNIKMLKLIKGYKLYQKCDKLEIAPLEMEIKTYQNLLKRV